MEQSYEKVSGDRGLEEMTSLCLRIYDLSLEFNCKCDQPYWGNGWDPIDSISTTTTTHPGEVTDAWS